MEIKIRCKGNRNVSYDKLKHFQGALKEMSVINAKKLKESILRYGWIAPVFVWHGDQILDGHGRLLILGEILKEGHIIADIPVVDIEAKDKQEAAKILLSLNSHYQTITEEGFYEFMHDFELKTDDLDIYALADLDLERFAAGYFEGQTEVIEGAEGKFKENAELYQLTLYLPMKKKDFVLRVLGKYQGRDNGERLSNLCETIASNTNNLQSSETNNIKTPL